MKSTKVLLTLPNELLSKIDGLATKNFTSRSVIIRWATAEFVNNNQPTVLALTEPKNEMVNGNEHPDDVRFRKFMDGLQNLEQ
jgi:metal-responsive CopG/Arc/MetJ family transcriptional regulator